MCWILHDFALLLLKITESVDTRIHMEEEEKKFEGRKEKSFNKCNDFRATKSSKDASESKRYDL